MGFYDSPKTDDNAGRCEESINALALLFTIKNGFIRRVETPDYGVDMDIELIKNKNVKEVTGIKFAIQAKSTKKTKTITKNDIKYISYNFETSRLGYLLRRAPYYGIITLYDEESMKTYFDYAEEIFNRIEEEQNDELWKNKKSINIHIPVEKEITQSNINDIYSVYFTRFQNHSLILALHGKKFGIPLFIKDSEFKEKDPIYLLDTFGSEMINNKLFDELCQLIEKADYKELIRNPKICLFAVLSFGETANVIEAGRYLQRANQHKKEYTDFESELLLLATYRIKFLTGELSFLEYGKEMENILENFKYPTNIANAKINVLGLKVFYSITNTEQNVDLEEELDTFFNEIKCLKINKKTEVNFIIQHINVIYIYTSIVITKIIARHRTMIKQGYNIDIITTNDKIKKCLLLEAKCESELLEILSYAELNYDKILTANIFLLQGKIFFNNQFNIFLLRNTSAYSIAIREEYEKNVNILMRAALLFGEKNIHNEAHLAFNILLEIKKMFKELYGQVIDNVSEESLMNMISSIERETGIKPYEALFEKAHQETIQAEALSENELLARMDDSKLEFFAKTQLEIQKIPSERLVNVILELKIFRHFHQNCKNEKIRILMNSIHTNNPETLYNTKPVYILENTFTNKTTPPSDNIEDMLNLIKTIE